MIYSRFQLLRLFSNIANRLKKAGITVAEIQAERSTQEFLNTPESSRIIKTVLDEQFEGLTPQEIDDQLHHMRALAFNLRYCLQGGLQVASLLLKEHLPNRQDVRKPEFRTPFTKVPNLSPVVGVLDKPLIAGLVSEPTSYLNGLIFEAIQAKDYSAKLAFRKIGDTLQQLEQESAVWSMTADDPIHTAEIMLCRTLSVLDHDGVPKRLADSSDEKIQVLRALIPAVASIARYTGVKSHPFYRFVNDLSDLSASTVANTEMDLQPSREDMLLDLQVDANSLSVRVKESAVAADAVLNRFHYGQPVYKEMLEQVRHQNSIIVADVNDIIRRFAYTMKQILPVVVAKEDEWLLKKWLNFLANTKILTTYHQHQTNLVAKAN